MIKVSNSNVQQAFQDIDRKKDAVFNGNPIDQTHVPSFQERLSDGIQNVANAQNDAATLAKNFELGTENDLAKVMVGQQVSSLAFQLTLNVRNKALSAYKDIMNMPV